MCSYSNTSCSADEAKTAVKLISAVVCTGMWGGRCLISCGPVSENPSGWQNTQNCPRTVSGSVHTTVTLYSPLILVW